MRFFSGKEHQYPLCSRGFTIIELLIVAAIIAIITSLVLVKYVSFDSTILLKGEAYEIALLLRETQVRSVSSYRNTEGGDLDEQFNYPYGVSFDTATPGSYVMFLYEDTDKNVVPEYPHADAVKIMEYNLPESMEIIELCYKLLGSGTCTSTDKIDISFRRPEFQSIFKTGYAGSVIIEKVQIKIHATRPGAGTGVFIVEVSKLGQISVYRE